jgi:hypothetical protein
MKNGLIMTKKARMDKTSRKISISGFVSEKCGKMKKNRKMMKKSQTMTKKPK